MRNIFKLQLAVYSVLWICADILCSGPSKHPGALSAYINLVPGTHHVRFIVDNDSRLSKSMPTAVDYNNFLVNYIEVAPPPPATESEAQKSRPQTATSPPPTAVPVGVQMGAHPPQVLPTAPTPVVPPMLKPDATPRHTPQPAKDTASTDTLASQIAQPKTAPIALGPSKKYHTQIPQYLLDIEAEEDQNLFPRASALISTLPEPPSLPMFLGKSVLNGATPMKDDASVLVMPNHTVLNHLATSSIKNKVLATSATTRYKKKVSQSLRGYHSSKLTLTVPHNDNVQTNECWLDFRFAERASLKLRQ